jgi:hypothetical protein
VGYILGQLAQITAAKSPAVNGCWCQTDLRTLRFQPKNPIRSDVPRVPAIELDKPKTDLWDDLQGVSELIVVKSIAGNC